MARTKYNIRLVHLLLEDDPDPQRQERSIEQLEKLRDCGIDYVQVWNKRWTEDPPRTTFARPQEFDTIPIRPSHYGCFRAFADGATDNFTEDIDAIILCEGDVKILDEESIIDKIDRAYEATQNLEIDYFSLGDRYTLYNKVLQSRTLEKHGDLIVTDKIIGIQMIMFPQRIREYLLDVYQNRSWDGADIFLNQNFMFKKRLGIFMDSPTSQWDGVSAIEDRVRNFRGGEDSSIKRLLYIAPHLSTGGMPQFLLKRVESLINEKDIEIHVVEFSNYSDDFVVQKNKLKELLGNRLHLTINGLSLEQREERLLRLIGYIEPDIIHIEECPESFDGGNKISEATLAKIYRKNRPYQIIETCHNIWMDNSRKTWHPNSYMYVTPYHPQNNFKDTKSAGSVVEYPIEDLKPSREAKTFAKTRLGLPFDKINVLNVGLWTSGKNQGEGVEIARIAEERYPGKFQFHFVGNQAGNFESYWSPIMKNLPSNVTVWGERDDTHMFYAAVDAFMFNSTWECAPLAVREAIAHGLPTFTRNLPQYLDMFTPYVIPFSDSLEENASILLRELIESGKNLGDFMPPTNDVERFRKQMLQHYSETHTAPEVTIDVKAHITTGSTARLHITQLPPGEFTAQFIDTAEDKIVYRTLIQQGRWYQPNQHWFTPWRVEILSGDRVVWSWSMPTQGGEVVVQFDSSSLGDSLVWMGQVERFKEHWGFSKVWVKTHKDWLWDTEYYASRGVQIGSEFPEGLPKIHIGVYYNMEEPWNRAQHRMDWRKIHLAQIGSDRLGIPFEERRPRLAPQFKKAPIKASDKPIVTFATHSTAGAKYWQREECWAELIDRFPNHRWIHTSKESHRPPAEQSGESLEEVASWMLSSQFFVGISSGLSWFAWALGVPTFIISGFTPSVVEESRGIWTIQNKRVCNSCWSWDVFDKGDWDWCPAHKGTSRQFECTKEISPGMVAERIMEVIDVEGAITPLPEKGENSVEIVEGRVSIILRTFNRGEWVDDAIKSVEYQDHRDWELLVFDDGDGVAIKPILDGLRERTGNRVELYVSNQPYYFFKKSWELAPSRASGELMIRLDDDDMLASNAVSTALRIFNHNPELDFSYGGVVKWNNGVLGEVVECKTPDQHPASRDMWSGYIKGYPYNEPWSWTTDFLQEPAPPTSIIHASKANLLCSYHTYIMRTESIRDVVDKIHITSSHVDDLEFMGRLDYFGLTHTALTNPIYYYRDHGSDKITTKVIDGRTIRDELLRVRDHVDQFRPSGLDFKSNTIRVDEDLETWEEIKRKFKLDRESIQQMSIDKINLEI
jgi:autotransporter strand-loop-strand O-heptosyltransferase